MKQTLIETRKNLIHRMQELCDILVKDTLELRTSNPELENEFEALHMQDIDICKNLWKFHNTKSEPFVPYCELASTPVKFTFEGGSHMIIRKRPEYHFPVLHRNMSYAESCRTYGMAGSPW